MTAKADRDTRQSTRAAHAVLQVMLGIGQRGVTIVPNYAKWKPVMPGTAAIGLNLRTTRAICSFTPRTPSGCATQSPVMRGAEAVRQLRPQDDAKNGAESEYEEGC